MMVTFMAASLRRRAVGGPCQDGDVRTVVRIVATAVAVALAAWLLPVLVPNEWQKVVQPAKGQARPLTFRPGDSSALIDMLEHPYLEHSTKGLECYCVLSLGSRRKLIRPSCIMVQLTRV